MKILQISRNLPVGELGGNDILFQLFEQLQEKISCKIDVIFPLEYIPKIFPGNRAKKLSALGGTIYRNGYSIEFEKYIRLPLLFQHYFAGACISKSTLHKAEHADLTHAHYVFPDAILANRLYRETNTPYIITVRSGDIERMKKIVTKGLYYSKLKEVLYSAKKIITMNVECSEYLKNKFNLECTLLSHGIEKSILDYNLEYKENDILKIVTCGEMIERKRIRLVCQAVKELKLTGVDRITLDVIGDGVELEALSNEYNEFANFHGRVPKDVVMQFFRESHVFSLLSLNETFGMVYIEAASQGNVIVANTGTGIHKHLSSEEAFFHDSKDELKQTLVQLLHEPELVEKYAMSAFDAIDKRMTWPAVCERYNKIYHEVLEIE